MPGPVAAYLRRPPMPGEAPPTLPADAGAGLARPVEARDPVTVLAEKVRSATLAGRVSFLPYLDPYTEETAAMRRMYPVMIRNPVVKQSLQHKVHSVAALDLLCVPADDTARDHEVADFVRYCYTEAMEGGFTAICEEVLYPTLIYKSALAEKVWYPDLWERGKFRGKRLYRCFKSKEYAQPLYDEFRNFVSVRATGFGQAEEFPASDFVFLRNWPLFGGPGMSDLRAAYKYLFDLDMLEKLHCIHMDRYVDPILAITYDESKGFKPGRKQADGVTTDKQALENDAKAMRGRSWLVIPESVRVEALQLAVRGEAEFLEICKDRREQIALSITGAYLQMLTATSGGDIRGNAKVQNGTSELLIWELAARLAAALNTQATPGLVDENYAGLDYPKVELGGISYEELLQAIQIDDKAQQMGAQLSARAMARKYSLQLAADPGDVLRRSMPVAPMIGGAFGGGADGGGSAFGGQGDGQGNGQGGGGRGGGDGQGNGNGNGTGPPSFRGGPAKDDPARKFAAGKDFALAGADGARVEKLLAGAQAHGARILGDLAARALARLVGDDPAKVAARVASAGRLFTPGERRQLQAALASTAATGHLLGAAKIRRRADQVTARFADVEAVRQFAEPGGRRFSDEPTDLQIFDETSPPPGLSPSEALEYFRSLVPGLAATVGAEAFSDELGRRAFTLAVTTDQTLLARVQDVIARRLESGDVGRGGAVEIRAILDEAGVTPANPDYAQMVFRTNLHEAYIEGSQREVEGLADIFPAWRYINPDDSRSRPEHAARNGLYYPSTRRFAEVRGTDAGDVCNCRCNFAVIDAAEWAGLVAGGAQLEIAA